VEILARYYKNALSNKCFTVIIALYPTVDGVRTKRGCEWWGSTTECRSNATIRLVERSRVVTLQKSQIYLPAMQQGFDVQQESRRGYCNSKREMTA